MKVGVDLVYGTPTLDMKYTVVRLYEGAMKALLRLYYGSIEALVRL
jgi:hypothetical protein